MSPDNTKPANTAFVGTATASAPSGPVEPTSPNYPPYIVEFSGGEIKSGGETVPLVKVTGPHTFSLLQPGGGSLTVSLSRNTSSDGIRPNLAIKFTQP